MRLFFFLFLFLFLFIFVGCKKEEDSSPVKSKKPPKETKPEETDPPVEQSSGIQGLWLQMVNEEAGKKFSYELEKVSEIPSLLNCGEGLANGDNLSKMYLFFTGSVLVRTEVNTIDSVECLGKVEELNYQEEGNQFTVNVEDKDKILRYTVDGNQAKVFDDAMGSYRVTYLSNEDVVEYPEGMATLKMVREDVDVSALKSCVTLFNEGYPGDFVGWVDYYQYHVNQSFTLAYGAKYSDVEEPCIDYVYDEGTWDLLYDPKRVKMNWFGTDYFIQYFDEEDARYGIFSVGP